MSNQFEDLVTSPYEDEPRRNRSLLRWLLGIGVLAVAVGVAVVGLGGDNAEEGTPVAAAPSVTSSVPAVTGGEGSGPGNDVGTDERLAELAFDPTAFGAEQTLEEIDEGKLTENWGVMVAALLNVDEEFQVGSIPEERLDLVGAIGVDADPFHNSFGGPTMCFGLVGVQGASVDCFATDPVATTRPLFTGLLGTGVVAWGLLPDTASIGVLTIDERAIAWQRPTRGIVAFRYDVFPGDRVALVVLSETGTEIAKGTRHVPPESTDIYVEPITGYGDYSDVVFEDLNFEEVDKLVVGCMNDYDIPAFTGTRSGPYHSINLSSIPEDDLPKAGEFLARCRIGLNLPERPTATEAQRRELYEQYVELHGCLGDLGYEIEAAPPYEVWALEPTETRWDPFLLMDIIFPSRTMEAMDACDS